MQELETGLLHRFGDWPNEQVPKRAAGVDTVWEGDRLLYVGMSGRAKTAEDLDVGVGGRVLAKGLWTWLNAHASGRRSGDQFCVYICDRFVVPALTRSQQQLAAGVLSLDNLIRAVKVGPGSARWNIGRVVDRAEQAGKLRAPDRKLVLCQAGRGAATTIPVAWPSAARWPR